MTQRQPRPQTAALLAVALAFSVSAPGAHAQYDQSHTQLLWGDTHLHTSHSTDAYSSGNPTIDPDAAYRFAKGEPVIHPLLGARTRISRPLDFLVVADHSDFLGAQVFGPRPDPRMTSPESRRFQAFVGSAPGAIFALMLGGAEGWTRDSALDAYRPVMMDPWLTEIDAAERHNEPGVFTAFAGWEWTSHIDNRNQHRVVFTPAPAESLRTFFPYSSLDSQDPEDLWAWLEQTSARIGSDFIAIPHNSNMSDGLMFGLVDSDGDPLTAEYARTRARWEPVAEMTQAKGTSETRPELSPNDEFADFEIFRRLFFAKEPVPSAADYLRPALLRGLAFEESLGINPYKLGLIGSSDIHTGMVTVEEDAFGGAVARNILPEARAAAAQNIRPPGASATLDAWDLSAAGLAAVWATDNTREAIAEAFSRREVYATTGPRITLRVFGGFRFRDRDSYAEDVAAIGYARGVPMGGDLTDAPRGRAPQLLIWAAKDPQGANLDRIQVIKGWLDADGETHEQVFNVAWSGERDWGAGGRIADVGDTVDLATASYTNDIGAPQLQALFTDPEFDPAERAFYYVRVLEIPTPRHHVYDAVALGIDPTTIDQPPSIQERAYSSPIWYAPS
jgi:hypothetical protein